MKIIYFWNKFTNYSLKINQREKINIAEQIFEKLNFNQI